MDELHGELGETFSTWAEVIAALERLAALPWDEPPDQAPCTSWRTCGRKYGLIQYQVSGEEGREIGRAAAFDVSAAGVQWHPA